jgi:hypothetical protein
MVLFMVVGWVGWFDFECGGFVRAARIQEIIVRVQKNSEKGESGEGETSRRPGKGQRGTGILPVGMNGEGNASAEFNATDKMSVPLFQIGCLSVGRG